MKKLQKQILLGCALTLVASSLAACGASKEAEPQGSKTAEASKEPLKISLTSVYYETEAPKKDNAVITQLQELTNTILDITWVPSTAYNDKVSTMMVSNDLPSVLLVNNDRDPVIRNGIRSGMFWEVGPYLKDYKNLSAKLDPMRLQNSSVDGKTYGLYRTRDLTRKGLIYRQDWLETLGLKPPQTMEELYEVLKAFTFKDPDGNGKDDTYGLVESRTLEHASMVAGWYGSPNLWSEDGTPVFMTEGYLKMMDFYKRLYSEKIMNQDFGIMEVTQKHDALMKGKAGAKFHILGDLQDIAKFDPMFKLFPTAKVDAISLLQGKDGNRSISENGYTGVFLIPKKSVKTEDELKRILSYFDNLLEPKVQNLLVHGIEGVDYKVVDGKVDRLKPEDPANRRIGWELGLYRGDAMPKATMRAEETKGNQMVIENEKVAVINPFASLDSATYLEKGAQLQTAIDDARIKYIMGILDEQGWKSVIEQWRKDGGDKMISEYKAEYAKVKK